MKKTLPPNTTLPLMEIERIEELCAKATPLPWQEGVAGHAGLVHFNGDDVRYVMAGQPHNRAFVEALGNAWPALCAEAKRAGELEKDAERYRKLRLLNWFDNTLAVVCRPKNNVRLGSDCPRTDRLDAAVDALPAPTEEQPHG